MAVGAILLPLSWYRLVDADYQFANFHMAASHFNMGTFIIISYFKYTENDFRQPDYRWRKLPLHPI